MDNVKIGFFKRIYYSIAGFDNYRHLIFQKVGKSIVYLLLLSFLLSLIGLIQPMIMFNKVINEVLVEFDKSIPDFTLQNGKLEVKGEMPIITGDGASTIIIDTSGNTDESILEKYDSAILITSDKMIQKSFANSRITDFAMLNGLKLDKNNIKNMLPIIKGISIFIFILLPPFIIAGRFISAFFVSIPGMIFNSVKNLNLRYSDIFSISAHSLTIPLILGLILDLVGVSFLLSTAVFYTISIVYIFGALNSIKKYNMPEQLPPSE